MKFFHNSAGPIPGREVDLDVDKDHDAAGDVERPEGRVHHVPDVFTQLKRNTKLFNYCLNYDCTAYCYSQVTIFPIEI